MIAIALASFKEALRKKIFLAVGILTIVYLTLFSLLVYFSMDNMRRVGADTMTLFMNASAFISVLGFYFSSMLVAFLTIMASVGAISSELANGSIHAIITKPIKRWEYVGGKLLGIGTLVIAYSVFLYFAVVIICAVIKLPPITTIGALPLLKGLLLFVFEPIVILALSIFGSVYFKTLTNGIFVIAIYILGMIGSMMEQIGALVASEGLLKWGILSSLISPFDVIYRQMTSAVFSDVGLSNPLFGSSFIANTVPSNWMNLYILIYLCSLIIFAVMKFNRKDIS